MNSPQGARPMQLVLLVGSNPLPNYLSACALRPSSIALIYTKATVDAKERLQRELAQALGGVLFDERFVAEPSCATTVRRALESLLNDGERDVLLNYTGGTKVMAAHARLAFHVARRPPEHASYLDEVGTTRSPCLRFDNGTWKCLAEFADIPFSLSNVLTLHGIIHTPRERRRLAPTSTDAVELVRKVLADLPLAAALYCERKRLEEFNNPNKATEEQFRAGRYGLTLSQPEFPTNEQLSQLKSAKETRSWFKQWYSFIGGEWLEEWLGEQIRAVASELGFDPDRDLTVGVNAKRETANREDPTMQIDIAIVRGHRSYFISCTTDTTKDLCKSKLFEIAVRSRQLGGDLARAALVCLADERTVQSLQKDVTDVWGSSNTTRVFGVSDIRAWSDCDGKQPDRGTLKLWLES